MKTKTPSLDDQPDLDKTLNQFLRAIDQGIPFDEAKEAILAWAESKAPEERPQTKYLGKRHSLIQGWNNGIEAYKRNLRGGDNG